MSELVPAANKGVAIPREGTEALRAGADHLKALLNSDSIEEVERGMKDLLAIAPVIEAANRPASESELGCELAMLIAAFPHSKADVGFSAVLIRYVADMRPSIGAVVLMRRHFICSAKFLPAISEVREVIEKKMRFIAACKSCVDGGVSRHLAWLKSKEAEERERQERSRRLERERKEQREREELERQRERKVLLEQEQRERKARNEAYMRQHPEFAKQWGWDEGEDEPPF
jgi:hypothetical protein